MTQKVGDDAPGCVRVDPTISSGCKTRLPRSTQRTYTIHLKTETQADRKCLVSQHEDTKSDPIVQRDAASIGIIRVADVTRCANRETWVQNKQPCS